MVSVSQIIDTKIPFKPSLEVQEFRKTLSKHDNGSLKDWYVKEALGTVILKQVS